MIEALKFIFSKSIYAGNARESQCRLRTIVSIALAITASIMLVINLKNHSVAMSYTSITLIVGFALSSIFAGILKMPVASANIIGVLVCVIFSIFAITGGNDGFAVLWILMVPMFSTTLLGVVHGLVVSTYFLIFLFVLFKTPLNVHILDKYNLSFIMRFPALYLCDYVIATYFSLQREYYQKKLNKEAYTDGMTGLYNRRAFKEQLEMIKKKDIYSLVMIDLNGLKRVNDVLGHEAGDDFISRISHIAAAEFNKNAYVCRVGGDEIAIIVRNSFEDIGSKITKMHNETRKQQEGLTYKLSFSGGYVHSVDYPDATPEELYKLADKEMYKSKMRYYHDNKHNRRQSPRIDVDAKGDFVVNFGPISDKTFKGRIVDISDEGIKIEADLDGNEASADVITEGMFITFNGEDSFQIEGRDMNELFNGQAEIMRKQITDGKLSLGCRIRPMSPTFNEYIKDRKMSVSLSEER